MHRTLRTAFALFTLASATSVFAQSTALASDALYARYVRTDPAQMPATGAAALPMPGPNAQHLIYLGSDPSDAIALARAQGEMPHPKATTPAAALPASGYDMYARNAAAATAATQGMHQAMR